MKTLIAIDPGKTGGVAWIDMNGHVCCRKCPDSEAGMAELIRGIEFFQNVQEGKIALIEAQQGGSFAGKGKACPECKKPPISAKAMFTFGRNYGTWLGILSAIPIAFQEITPKAWQAAFGNLPKDAAKRKSDIHRRVQNRWPNLKAPKYIADALAILAVMIDRQVGEPLGCPTDNPKEPEQPELFGKEDW